MELQRFPDSDTRQYTTKEVAQQAVDNITYLTRGRWRARDIGSKTEFEQDIGWDPIAKTDFKKLSDRVFGVRTSPLAIGRAKTVGDACGEICRVLEEDGRLL